MILDNHAAVLCDEVLWQSRCYEPPRLFLGCSALKKNAGAVDSQPIVSSPHFKIRRVVFLFGAKEELAWSGYRLRPYKRQRIFSGSVSKLVFMAIPDQRTC